MITTMNINFSWVKGHANNAYNNRVDHLAVNAYRSVLDKKK
jgi:ribonuclease HI